MKFILTALGFALLLFFTYRLGLRDAGASGKREGDGAKANFRVSLPEKETDEQRRARIALENIENYGTSAAQQEVK